jgi:hypothetical protein
MRHLLSILLLCFTVSANPFLPILTTQIAPPASSFPTTDLVSHYRFDEASGSATDVHGSKTLTDNNTVTSAAGKVGTSRQFTRANAEFFTSSAFTFGNTKFAVACWVYMDSKPANPMYIAAKATGGGASGREFELFWDNSVDRFVMKTGGGINVTATANTFGAPSTATWYFIYAYHDSVADQIGISVNGGAFDTANTSNSFAGTTTGLFNVGNYDTGVGTVWNWDGRIDSLSVYIGGFNTSDRTTLYNGGSGLDY